MFSSYWLFSWRPASTRTRPRRCHISLMYSRKPTILRAFSTSSVSKSSARVCSAARARRRVTGFFLGSALIGPLRLLAGAVSCDEAQERGRFRFEADPPGRCTRANSTFGQGCRVGVGLADAVAHPLEVLRRVEQKLVLGE